MYYDKEYNLHPININLSNILPCLANSLRRTMISDIPNVGFDNKYSDNSNNNSIKIIGLQ